MRKIFQIFAFSLIILSGCSKENINHAFNDIVVVEGYLYAGRPLEIKVSRQVPYSNEAVYSPDNLDSLSLSVFDGNLHYELNSIGDGKYSHPEIKVIQHNNYELHFYYNNTLVSTETVVPEKPVNFSSNATNVDVSDNILIANNPDELELSWDNANGSFYFLLVENIESEPTLINENTDVSFINKSFNLPPTQSDKYLIKTRLFSYYGSYRIILFNINTDLAALYESNDNTSQNITSPPTDLENAFGIFTGINADTLYININ